MNKDIKTLIKLYESEFSSIFDDIEDVINQDDDIPLSNSHSKKILMQQPLGLILTDLIGTDKPKAWKKSQDSDGIETVVYSRKGTNYTPKQVLEVINIFKSKGFIEYNACRCPICFTNGITALKYFKNYYNTSTISTGYTDEIQSDVDNWIKNEFPKMPEIVQHIFQTDPTYKTVYLSKDEGIILTVQNGNHAFPKSEVNQYFITATIKLTGNVIYKELDKSEAKKIQNNKKDFNSRITFLTSKVNNIKAGLSNIFKNFTVNSNNEPIGISYFNWNEQCGRNKLPSLLKALLIADFYAYNDIEKEDSNAIYELTKNAITVKIYKDVDCANADATNTLGSSKPNSYITCELDDYLLTLFHKIYK